MRVQMCHLVANIVIDVSTALLFANTTFEAGAANARKENIFSEFSTARQSANITSEVGAANTHLHC